MNGRNRNIRSSDQLLFKKPCNYIGSIACTQFTKQERQYFVNDRLLEMKDSGVGVPVIMCITEEGVKVLHENGKSVKLAHGITRLAFTTSHPTHRLFAYVAKNLNSRKTVTIQAHMFKMKKVSHIEQVSSSFSNAFKIAYAKDTMKRQNRVKLFENEALEAKVTNQKTDRGKKWAKLEIARGHQNSEHAQYAVGTSSPSVSRNLNHELQSVSSQEVTENPIGNEKSADNTPAQETIQSPINIPPNVNIRNKIRQTKSSPIYAEIIDLPRKQMLNENIKNKPLVSTTSCDENLVAHPTINKDATSTSFNKSPVDRSQSLQETVNDSVQDNTEEEITLQNNNENVNKFSHLQKIQQPVSKRDKNDNIISIGYENTSVENTELITNLSPVIVEHDLFDSYFTADQNEYENVLDYLSKGYDNVRIHDSLETDTTPEYYENQKSVSIVPMSEEDILKASEWYQPGITREIAEEHVCYKSNGAFLIRDSKSQPGNFVLTMKVPKEYKSTGIANFLIEKTSDLQFRIKGYKPCFKQLTDLIAHYNSFSEDIPCKLLLDSKSPLYFRKIHIDQPDFPTPEFSEEKQIVSNIFSTEISDDEWDTHDYEDIEFCRTTSITSIMKELEELTMENR